MERGYRDTEGGIHQGKKLRTPEFKKNKQKIFKNCEGIGTKS